MSQLEMINVIEVAEISAPGTSKLLPHPTQGVVFRSVGPHCGSVVHDHEIDGQTLLMFGNLVVSVTVSFPLFEKPVLFLGGPEEGKREKVDTSKTCQHYKPAYLEKKLDPELRHYIKSIRGESGQN